MKKSSKILLLIWLLLANCALCLYVWQSAEWGARLVHDILHVDQ